MSPTESPGELYMSFEGTNDMSAVADKTSKSASEDVIRLNFQDGAREVIVQTEDEDRFWLTCEDAARACKRHMGLVEWKREFTRLLSYLRVWMEGEKSLVRACYVSLREGHLAVIIVPNAGEFDFTLAPKAASLQASIAKEFKACPSEVLQVPQCAGRSLEGFMNTGQAMLVYGS